MPYVKERSIASYMVVVAGLALLGATAPNSEQYLLAWHIPSHSSQLVATSTVDQNVSYQMSSMLKAAAGHRADPVYVVEARTRTFFVGAPSGTTGAQSANQVYVDDQFARRHGGPNNTDTTVKRRSRKQIVPFDTSGKYSIEPYLCQNEPPLNDADPNPKTYSQCSEASSDQRHYQDPGDAALAEFPTAPIKVGSTWTFTRPVAVGREFASGTMTFVDTLQQVAQEGSNRVALVDVSGTGRIDVPKDLQSRGFHTTTMTFSGTAEFNLTSGAPGAQHYTGHAEWHASVFGAKIGIVLDETYDGKAWTSAPRT